MDLLQDHRNHKDAGNITDVEYNNLPENLTEQMGFVTAKNFQSPTISDRSLIFERNVQNDPFLLPYSNNTTLTSLTAHDLSKQRSNSNVSLTRQRTGDSIASTHSFSINDNSTPVIPLPISIIPNRRLSRTNSSASFSNPLLSPLSKSVSYSSSFIPTSNGNSVNSNIAVSSPLVDDGFHHHRRRTLENSVAPALDASCSLMAEDVTDIADVNIIHSRSSSTIGLDMALGRLSNHSQSNNNSNNSTNTDETHNSNTNDQQNKESESNGSKVLNFYSYNDLLTDEKIKEIHSASNPNKRPSLTISKSASNFKMSTSPSQQANNSINNINNINSSFFNPFAPGRSSSVCLSPQQQSRKPSFNNGNISFSKSPISPSSSVIEDTLTNNINHTSSVLLQDPVSTGNLTSLSIKNHLNKSINRNIAHLQSGKWLKEAKLVESMSQFHFSSSESDCECDSECEEERSKNGCIANETNDSDDIAVDGYYPGHGVNGSVSCLPTKIKNLRSSSNSSIKNTSFLLKTTNFLDSKSKASSVITLQQYFDNNPTEHMNLNDSIPVENFQLQKEKIGDMIKDKVLSSK